jgi:hypothetical protein
MFRLIPLLTWVAQPATTVLGYNARTTGGGWVVHVQLEPPLIAIQADLIAVELQRAHDAAAAHQQCRNKEGCLRGRWVVVGRGKTALVLE